MKSLIGADESKIIMDEHKNVTHLFLDEKEVIVNSASDLANNVYDMVEEEMGTWRETHQYK